MKPAREAISTLRGEGTWGTTGGREQVGGQGPGRLQTILPRSTGAPDLACTNEATPRGESPTAIRPRHRRPPGRDSADTLGHARTRSHTEMLAHKGLHRDVSHTSHTPYRTGWERGTLVYLLLAGLGRRLWAREPGEREKQTVNMTRRRTIGRRRRTRQERRQDERNILSSLCFRTFRCHYVSPEY